MINMQKHFVKMVSGVLSAVMLTYALVPAAAFAAHRPAPTHHGPRPRYVQQYRHYAPYRPHYASHRPLRHHYYHDRWTKHDTAAVAGLAALIGLIALANNKHRDRTSSYDTATNADYQNANVSYDAQAVQVLNLVNAERAKVGSGPLRLAQDLQNAAAVRAEEITRSFSHIRPDGRSCFTLVRDQKHTMGENIAAGSSTPEAVVDQWMHSPGHRANMLNKSFKELGVGHMYKQGSTYGHYWIQMFRG